MVWRLRLPSARLSSASEVPADAQRAAEASRQVSQRSNAWARGCATTGFAFWRGEPAKPIADRGLVFDVLVFMVVPGLIVSAFLSSFVRLLGREHGPSVGRFSSAALIRSEERRV